MTRPPAAPAALALLGAFLSYGCSEPPAVAFVHPQRQDLVSYVTTNGQVDAGERAEVYAETTGRIVKVDVKEGQPVARGEALLTIDDRAAREELAQAQAQLDASRAELQGLEQGGTPAEIAELESELAAAKRSHEQLEKDVQALGRLVEKQAAPRVELDAARRQWKEAGAKADLLEEKLAVRFAPHDKERAKARVRAAEAAVALAMQKVGSASVAAPLAGVVYSLPVRQGAYVSPGTLVARVGKLGRVDVAIYVDEPELGRVKLSAPVRIRSDAYPEKHWECRIDRLPAEVVALDTRRVGELHCRVEDAGELIPNLRVSVEIESDSAANVLTLPREATFRDGNRTLVWLVNQNGQAEQREVEPGVASASRVEIRSGLSESDRVLLPGQQALTEGRTVRLADNGDASP
jgi:multidrug efflux pump subunit AcrA (membrane-fusion protein)